MKKSWVILGLMVVIIGMWRLISSNPEPFEEVRDPSSTYDGRRDDTDLNESSCVAAGGAWNPCGSACRTDPDAICIELCVEYCECKSSDQCPSGYVCDDFVDGIGVCR